MQEVGGTAAERAAGRAGGTDFERAAAMESIGTKEWDVPCSTEVAEPLT